MVAEEAMNCENAVAVTKEYGDCLEALEEPTCDGAVAIPEPCPGAVLGVVE